MSKSALNISTRKYTDSHKKNIARPDTQNGVFVYKTGYLSLIISDFINGSHKNLG